MTLLGYRGDMTRGARIGADIGGSFTDVVTVSDGRARVRKVPPTPETPAEGVLDGVKTGVEWDVIDTGSVGGFVHGTTVATNAVLEGKQRD